MKKNRSSESGIFNPRVFLAFLFCATGGLLAVFSLAAPAPSSKAGAQANGQFKPVTISSTANGVSARVRDLPVTRPSFTAGTWEVHAPLPIHPPHAPPQLPVNDPVQQTVATLGPLAPAPLQTFEGMNQADGCGNCIPPDPNGAVGPNHYVEMVNSSYSVYSKTGTRLAGPIQIQQLFSVLTGSRCAATNDGDPVVVYDHLADRFVLSQFSVNGGSGPYAQCIAVSTGSDPTGAYYVYDFDESTTVFHDYPKLGVWPDAYYMTTNEFAGTAQTFAGAGIFAFERDKMLAGQPARMVFFDEGAVNSSFGGMLPSHLDGTPPPAGSPNYFAEVDSQINTPSLGADAMRIWKFHVDWSNTNNSTFGIGGQPDYTLPVAMWTPAQCVEAQGTCVPQEASPYQLDVLGDRLMFRLVYRNFFGNHESLLISHSVVADARIGVRWYEVRNAPGNTLATATPAIYQQGTFAPVDQLYRWMGSIAMDRAGNIAVGYSTSGPANFPSIAAAGRLPNDPLGQMSQGETQLFAGLGPENVGFFVPPVGRWGDYTDLTIDPADGCTFWYVNEYFASLTDQGANAPGAPWQTRISSFKFPTCAPVLPSPVRAVSRKIHGTAGAFDIDLLPPNPAIEMRRNTGGDMAPAPNAGRDHEVIITFPVPVRVASVTVTSNNMTDSPNATFTVTDNVVTVDLHNVTIAPRRLTINLIRVNDFNGGTADVHVPLNVLLGDVNSSKRTDNGDAIPIRNQSGSIPNSTTFRSDVNCSGRIDNGDAIIVRNNSGAVLPP
jgi:hypothetical protein